MITLFYIPRIYGSDIEGYLFTIIFGVPVFFFFKWIYTKLIDNYRKRRIAIWVSTVVATPVIFVGSIMFFLYSPTRDFDKQSWLENKKKRYQMSANIIESKMLIGKSAVEVKTILGDGMTNYNDGRWNYELGFSGFGSVGIEILYIVFKNGKVTEVGRYSD